MSKSAVKNPDIAFIVHGRASELEPLIAKQRNLSDCVEIRDVEDVVTMDAKPSNVMRNGKSTSMWSAYPITGTLGQANMSRSSSSPRYRVNSMRSYAWL